jgi:hypothetical protein
MSKLGPLSRYIDYVRGWRTEELGFDSLYRQDIYLSSMESRSVLGFLYKGYQCIIPGRKTYRGVKLTTHLRLVPRLRIYGSISSVLHTPSCVGV